MLFTLTLILRVLYPLCARISSISLHGGCGGKEWCCEYAIFGSKELADKVVEALEGRTACLMANHGLVCCGKKLEHAMFLAEESWRPFANSI